MENMWNFNLEDVNVESPKAILEEQAKLLPPLTGDMVYASVDEENRIEYAPIFRGDFMYSFQLKSKFLPNYSFQILVLSHDIPMYPLKMIVDGEVFKELNIEGSGQTIIIQNEEDFRNQLRNILSSKRISSVIGAIIKLAK